MNTNTKQCPFCGEDILAVAIKCKHCGSMIDGRTQSQQPKASSEEDFPHLSASSSSNNYTLKDLVQNRSAGSRQTKSFKFSKPPKSVYIIAAIVGVLTFLFESGIIPRSAIPFLSVSGLNEYNQGVSYQETNQITLAEQQYKIAIQKNPNNASAYLNLGVIYLNNGWYDGAEQMTKKSISILQQTQKTSVKGSTLEQSFSLAFYNLGAIEINRGIQADAQLNYVVAKNHWKKGMSYLRNAVELDPMNSRAQAAIKNYENAYTDN